METEACKASSEDESIFGKVTLKRKTKYNNQQKVFDHRHLSVTCRLKRILGWLFARQGSDHMVRIHFVRNAHMLIVKINVVHNKCSSCVPLCVPQVEGKFALAKHDEHANRRSMAKPPQVVLRATISKDFVHSFIPK